MLIKKLYNFVNVSKPKYSDLSVSDLQSKVSFLDKFMFKPVDEVKQSFIVSGIDGSRYNTDVYKPKYYSLIFLAAITFDYILKRKHEHIDCDVIEVPSAFEADAHAREYQLEYERSCAEKLFVKWNKGMHIVMLDGSIGFSQKSECKNCHIISYTSNPRHMSFKKGVYDIEVMQKLLKPWTYCTPFICPYSKNTAFYLNVKKEIVRIDCLSKDLDLIAKIVVAVSSQVNKGNGYPLCLMLAHKRATITRGMKYIFESKKRHLFSEKNRFKQMSNF